MKIPHKMCSKTYKLGNNMQSMSQLAFPTYVHLYINTLFCFIGVLFKLFQAFLLQKSTLFLCESTRRINAHQWSYRVKILCPSNFDRYCQIALPPTECSFTSFHQAIFSVWHKPLVNKLGTQV